MTRSRRSPRVVAAAAGALACFVVAWAAPAQDPPQAPGDQPGVQADVDLLSVPPFDRVTLVDNTVVDVEPLIPRPLPPYDAAKAEKRRRANSGIPAGGNIRLPGEKAEKVRTPREVDDEEDKLANLNIHLIQGDVRDFVVKRADVKRIDYFEDMLIAEGDRSARSRDYDRAFECYLKVKARDPSWKGLDDHVNQVLFDEGGAALVGNDSDRGLRMLRELFARKPDFPGLADKLASSYSGRAQRAFEIGLYARGRKILHDVDPFAPNHVLVNKVRETFARRAQELVKGAEKAKGAARLDALAEALLVWPTVEGGEAAYRKAFADTPTLEVAVVDLPTRLGPWLRSPADARLSRLLFRPVLANDSEEAAQGKAEGQLAASTATADLGRRFTLTLRDNVRWSDGSRPVSSIDVARALTDAAEPNSPRFLARWADLLDRVEQPDETHVEVRLTRATLKPEVWLTGPVGPAHGGPDGRVATIDRRRELVGDGPYKFVAATADRLELKADDRPTTAGSPAEPAKVRRLVEARYPNARQAVGAFLRGEVTVLERVPPDRLAEVAANPAFQVGKYAKPSLHRIAIDGRNPVLRNRNLRRALSYAIDRRTVLEDVLLKHPSDEANLASDGPFPKGGYADAPGVKPLPFDPGLARALAVAAHKELNVSGAIKLRFEYPNTPEARLAAPAIAQAFRAAGLEVVAEEKSESELETELRSGRRFDLAYRASRCDEPVVDAGPLVAPAYDAPPSTDPLGSVASPRILQLLLELERAPEWPTARGVVIEIDRECRDELPALPLWQVEEHYAWRTRLKGPPEVTDQLYETLGAWEVDPWYAKDPW